MEKISGFQDFLEGKHITIKEEYVCPTCDLVQPKYHRSEWTIATLCKCEFWRRDSYNKLIEFANLPKREGKVFGTFYVPPGNAIALEAARSFAQGNNPPILFLHGSPGCGKTHLIEAVGRYVLEQGVRVKYAYVPEFLRRIRNSFNNKENTEQIIDEYYRPPVLLLDDVGSETATDWAAEQLTALVDDRYRNERRLMVTSNNTHAHMNNRGYERLASRLFDTETGIVKNVELFGDYRNGKK